MPTTQVIRRRLRCRGVVQGVGFRPAVYRLATGCGLAGFVRNDVEGVTVEVEGAAAAVAAFERAFAGALPPRAVLTELRVEPAPVAGGRGFAVEESQVGRRGHALTPPDLALCAACRRDVEDARDRRYRYPFTTCTDCGPRFSLVRSLPYDRERTSMARFPLCPRCTAEYRDPTDRRFHAEPVCCPVCGPRLWLETAAGEVVGERREAIAAAQHALARGEIVAVKGLGGFQLACRADDETAVRRLRARKHRAGKPLALMVRDLATAHRLAALSAGDAALLRSAQGPIVLAPRRAGAAALVAPSVAPGVDDLGVMLPTTPLHVELLRTRRFAALVMTSGNASDEPICIADDDARRRLGGIADALLLHDREIVRRVDDSVVRAMPAPLAPCVVRRSRGWAPGGLRLPFAAPVPVLALGGHLQNTACVAVGDMAHPSQHVGDLDTDAARAFLREVATGLEAFLAVESRLLACDLHPDYPSTWLADSLAAARGGRAIRIQHHVAHAAAVLAEHGAFPAARDDVAFALVLDGTGFGTDGTAWGCELLALDGALGFRRVAHGEALPLVGGEAAVREPWRVAVAALARAGLADHLAALPLAATVTPDRLTDVARLGLASRWPHADGAGRLFEAAGALLGLATHNRCEGDAAMRLEALAATAPPQAPWPEVGLGPTNVLPHGALLAAAARRALGGEDPAAIARGVHDTFAALAVALALRTLPAGADRIALGGGCLVNRLLAHGLTERFAQRRVRVLRPIELPPGDGGLAFGQAVLAVAAAARGAAPHELPPPLPTTDQE